MPRRPTTPGRCRGCGRTLRLHADRTWTKGAKPGGNMTTAGFRCPACRTSTVRHVDVEEQVS